METDDAEDETEEDTEECEDDTDDERLLLMELERDELRLLAMGGKQRGARPMRNMRLARRICAVVMQVLAGETAAASTVPAVDRPV